MRLTVISFLIIFLTFVFREIFRDWLKELRDGVSSAENLFRNELGQANLTLQLTQMQTDLKAQQNKSAVLRAKRTHNFSKIINEELGAMKKRVYELGQMEQSTERLLKPLPRGARELRKEFQKLREKVKHVTVASFETEKSLTGKDWPESALVLVKIMELAFTEVQIAVFADRVLTYAKTVRDAAGKLYWFCNWIGYTLYVVGISLGLYANLSGIKHMMGME